ncbi:Gfo/Idh/MocA family protein [Virgibacillus ihumii]|uniref:Gfo/Idh/MocA family protein n=1 Tax=Virgibacillus ihumii TaxID=2686091 RepID=UPI00157C2085|nr:Gfo/Idh/MocA family oxidoreductase [Virgibacillus ihumii]
MDTLKVAVVGCGSIARNRHLPEYAAEENVQIKAVCDVVEERAMEMANLYGSDVYIDYHEMVKETEIDAVSVCTPNALHAPVSIAALEAGKHVLCEKPMATSSEEAEEMIQAAEKSGKKLMIAHNQRFVPSHQKARELIENGEIGKIYSFRTTFGHGGPEGWSVDGKRSWFFKKELAFIGAMGDLGVHKSDLIRYLLADEIAEVGALVENSAKENIDVDDNAVCILKTITGIIGTLTASWSYVSSEDNSTIIYGENAILRLEDDPVNSLVVQYKNGETVKYELGQIQSNDEDGQTSTAVIEHFVSSVLQDKPVPVSGDEGKKSLEVILAALDSSETKQLVQLN